MNGRFSCAWQYKHPNGGTYWSTPRWMPVKVLLGDVMSELAAKIESVNEQARLYNAAIAEFIAEASERIETLTAELAAKEDWTPITSVEQVRELVPGYYLFKTHNDYYVSVRSVSPWWKVLGRAENTEQLWEYAPFWKDKAVYEEVKSYKLIRAFEEPEKKYKIHESHKTPYSLKEVAEIYKGGIGELARDLLAAQARIRELEGK